MLAPRRPPSVVAEVEKDGGVAQTSFCEGGDAEAES